MSITIYVPCDSSAVSLGADRVAAAITKEAEKRGIAIELIVMVQEACSGWNRWLKWSQRKVA